MADDGPVNAVVESLVERVLPSLFGEGRLTDADGRCLASCLGSVLHWAVHVGQSAYHLLSTVPHPRSPDDCAASWRLAIHDIWYHPLIMLHTEDAFSRLVQRADRVRSPMYGSTHSLARLDKDAVFTRARLALTASQAEEAAAGNSDGEVFGLVVSDLYARARLYIGLLEWLVKPVRRRKGQIRDCVITLCALALEMSADALRLLWPI